MHITVIIVGFIILGIGIGILISPAGFKKGLRPFLAKRWLSFATVIRILVGILLVLAASETGAPLFIHVVGILLILVTIKIFANAVLLQ